MVSHRKIFIMVCTLHSEPNLYSLSSWQPARTEIRNLGM